uniref:hypothetical protein n=1 Tax=Brunnivagina elsteri TaxID=1247191 RepID=UPI001FE6A9CA|nr:hypothetical protein [Calothrix elsteri]
MVSPLGGVGFRPVEVANPKGEYKSCLPEVIFENEKEELQFKSKQSISITHGYSRDHRPDLKQFLMELICTGDGESALQEGLPP